MKLTVNLNKGDGTWAMLPEMTTVTECIEKLRGAQATAILLTVKLDQPADVDEVSRLLPSIKDCMLPLAPVPPSVARAANEAAQVVAQAAVQAAQPAVPPE